MDEMSLSIIHWIRTFIAGITDSSKMDKQLKKLLDNSHHPLFPSLHQALYNSWTAFCTQIRRDSNTELPNNTQDHCSLNWAQTALDFSWEQLNMGNWKDVELLWREAYSVAALLKALCLAWEGNMQEALVEVDKGILLGAPVLDKSLQSLAALLTREIHSQDMLSEAESIQSRSLEVIHRSARVQYGQKPSREDDKSGCLDHSALTMGESSTEEPGAGVQEQLRRSVSPDFDQVPNSSKRHKIVSSHFPVSSKKHKIVFKNYKPFQSEDSKIITSNHLDEIESDLITDVQEKSVIPLIDPSRRILVRHCPSLEEFLSKFMMTSTPVVISGAMDHWPAYASRKWRYFLSAQSGLCFLLECVCVCVEGGGGGACGHALCMVGCTYIRRACYRCMFLTLCSRSIFYPMFISLVWRT